MHLPDDAGSVSREWAMRWWVDHYQRADGRTTTPCLACGRGDDEEGGDRLDMSVLAALREAYLAGALWMLELANEELRKVMRQRDRDVGEGEKGGGT